MGINLIIFAAEQLGVKMSAFWAWVILVVGVILLVLGGISGIVVIVKRIKDWSKQPTANHTSTYASGPYHHTVVVAGTSIVIDNIEENDENVSITGMIDKRPVAVVLSKRRLPPNLAFNELLEKYAWALLEAHTHTKR